MKLLNKILNTTTTSAARPGRLPFRVDINLGEVTDTHREQFCQNDKAYGKDLADMPTDIGDAIIRVSGCISFLKKMLADKTKVVDGRIQLAFRAHKDSEPVLVGGVIEGRNSDKFTAREDAISQAMNALRAVKSGLKFLAMAKEFSSVPSEKAGPALVAMTAMWKRHYKPGAKSPDFGPVFNAHPVVQHYAEEAIYLGEAIAGQLYAGPLPELTGAMIASAPVQTSARDEATLDGPAELTAADVVAVANPE